MKRFSLLLLTFSVLLVACNRTTQQLTDVSSPPDKTMDNTPNPFDPSATSSPYDPQPKDDLLIRGNVYLDTKGVVIAESYPVQIFLALTGNLPTPCHNLRVAVNPPDEENRIMIDVYSVSDLNLICAQVLAPFNASIPLGSFSPGHYTVWVNGEQAGEFDA